MELPQLGDAEGTFLFDPTHPSQAACAIRVARVKRRRQARRTPGETRQRRRNAVIDA